MSHTKFEALQVATLVQEDPVITYPVECTSTTPLPDLLPKLSLNEAYHTLTLKARVAIRRVAKRVGREVRCTINVEFMGYDPTQPVETTGVYLVATIEFE